MASEGGSLVCCIHFSDSGSDQSIIRFTEETLKKCSTVRKVRAYNKLKYAHFNLPSKVDDINGYHTACYRRFTAIKQSYYDKVPSVIMKLPSSSTIFSSQPQPSGSKPSSAAPLSARPRRERLITSSGVLKKICLFCGKRRKSYRRKDQTLKLATDIVEGNVIEAAAVLNDRRVLNIIDTGDFVAKEIRYHNICMKRYMNTAKTAKQKIGREQVSQRELNEKGFDFVFHVVQKDVIEEGKVFTLTELFTLFKNKIESITEVPRTSEISLIRPQYLEEKLLDHFKPNLLVDRSPKDHVFFKYNMDFVPAVVEKKLREAKHDFLIRETAFSLRQEIMSAEVHKLPSRNVTLSDVYKGDCDIPNTLRTFIGDLIYGPSTSQDSQPRNRRINSICSDIVFSATNGRMKPSKQLVLGSVVKTLTGSKKTINILNRLGHAANYNTIEELETELSYSSHDSTSLVSHPIHKDPTLFTSVAFNNFDRFVETLSGKNTLHDTVGIIIQNDITIGNEMMEVEVVAPNVSIQQEGDETEASNTLRRRRRFEEVIFDIEPYFKKPKLANVAVFIEPLFHIPAAKDFRTLDILWALHFFHEPESPMWVGFNASLLQDDSPSQKIAYLPQINASPTSYAVVRHTLRMASQVMEECGQNEILCTYDLNIAKMALEIQNQDQPTFDNIFVGLGPFHIEMAMFKAIGKFIDGSGITEILNQAGILAQGSTLGFISGTNYNRCKRIHRLLASTLRKLNYDHFLSTKSAKGEDALNDIDVQKLLTVATNNRVDIQRGDLQLDPKLETCIADYIHFEQQTAQGKHGLTAQMWAVYIQYIDLYNDFNRSVRMGDVILFVHSLFKINDLFFIMNHQNYARWLVPFTDNIIRALDRDDYIARQFKQGLFSVKRTSKSFSRTPIDLTLEQTINADAGNKLGGIVSTTDSISARQRWAYSHSQRTDIVTHLLQDTGLTTKEDITNDMRRGRIARDHKDVGKILEAIDGMINPFDETLEPSSLFNLCTGKSASAVVSNFLKTVPSKGREQHLAFRLECSTDFPRFYRAIRRNRVSNFVDDHPKVTVKKSQQIQNLKAEKNLFCRLLMLSLEKKLDLQSVLRFPLSAVPLSLGHPDGTTVKTQKSVLLKHLEGLTTHEAPPSTDVLIVDGFFFMHQLGNNLPSTYGDIAKAILKKLRTSNCPCIHLVFDRYISPSIKDMERQSRGAGGENVTFHITNREQKRPVDFLKALRITQFKQSLVTFLVGEWSSSVYAEDFKRSALYVTKEETCYFYYSLNGTTVTVHEDESYRSGHVEADSRMVYHLTKVVDCSNVVIRTCDTDVIVIIVGNLHNICDEVSVWIETGSVARNDHRFIDIRKIAEVLGPHMCRALPALHALTGSDYTSAFFRLGKKKPFTIVQHQDDAQRFLSAFGQNHSLTTSEFHSIEKLICAFYTRKQFHGVDELRLHLFMDAYNRISEKDPLKTPKGIESSNFPPCQKALYQHALRAKYVTLIWCDLHQPDPPAVSPTEYGWDEVNGAYVVKWFEGHALPEKLEEILSDETESPDAENAETSSDVITDSSDEEVDDD